MNVGNKYLLLTMTVALLTSLPYTFTENMFITQTGIFVLTPMATYPVSYCNMVNYTTSFQISKVVVTQTNSTNATVAIIEEYYG